MSSSRKWLEFLAEGELTQSYTNVEHVEAVSDINKYNVLDYVLRTLEVFDKYFAMSCPLDDLVRIALQWAEVAKGGSKETRENWLAMGYNLAIHNIGSASIYKDYSTGSDRDRCIAGLIMIHGTVGQYIRGEIGVRDYNALKLACNDIADYVVLNGYNMDTVKNMILSLSKSTIGGVSMDLLHAVEIEVNKVVDGIFNEQKEVVLSQLERVKRIKPNFSTPEEQCEFNFTNYSFWYAQVAIEHLTDETFLMIMNKAIERARQVEGCYNINFKNISDFLYYDYKDGKKRINVYKLRILEAMTNENGVSDHIRMTFNFSLDSSVLYVGYELSPVCEKLVEFCVEAERSGNLSYEKAIVLVFDFFNFRKDSFDRLSNERDYLSCMNDIARSRKGELLNYVVGEKVVDVGSGGGVLLDLLEDRYPDKTIIGTDISAEVIDRLKNKAVIEKRGWSVQRHNFVESPLDEKVDTIVFSSILHEIYSFTEYDGSKFNIKSIHVALKNAYDSLNSGGRILIRDGVKSNEVGTRDITIFLNSKEGKTFFLNYLNDFKGLSEYDRKGILCETVYVRDEFDSYKVTADENYIKEFMMTYTWGISSYSQEVQEQFGYMTISEFESLINELGGKLVLCMSYQEKDYKEHLSQLLDYGMLNGEDFTPLEYPDTNCMVVIEKP